MTRVETREYIRTLQSLKAGDLGLLRSHAGRPLDESVQAFDLFTGIWWPLRQKSSWAPRREVAWLIAKLYAYQPLADVTGVHLAWMAGATAAREGTGRGRADRAFDTLLLTPLRDIEYPLRRLLGVISRRAARLDWAQLIDDLSDWECSRVRQRWADEYLNITERSDTR